MFCDFHFLNIVSKYLYNEVAPILADLFNNILLKNNKMTKSMREGLITIIYKGKGDRTDLKKLEAHLPP